MRDFPSELADRCVMCAQCLPHCPTWRLSRQEAESPRGRIALMQALHSGRIGPDTSTLAHLDQCLDCRRCEAVCPAEVPYGALHDAAQRELGGARRHRGLPGKAMRWLAARPRPFSGLAARLLRAWAGSRLRGRVSPRLPPVLRRLERLLPRHAPAAPHPGRYGHGTPVSLFLGCIARAIDGDTLQACVRALGSQGFEVRVPEDQGCCGALHLHAGDERTARTLMWRNLEAFADGTPVVTAASGCAATLLDYARLDPGVGTAFAGRVVDVMRLLERSGAPPAAARQGAALHTPCTLESVQRTQGSAAAMLTGARVMPSQGRCCGAAGEYLLAQPGIADALRDGVLDEAGEPAVLCTSNPGCAMHLRAGLEARNLGIPVTHPVVEWLQRT